MPIICTTLGRKLIWQSFNCIFINSKPWQRIQLGHWVGIEDFNVPPGKVKNGRPVMGGCGWMNDFTLRLCKCDKWLVNGSRSLDGRVQTTAGDRQMPAPGVWQL